MQRMIPQGFTLVELMIVIVVVGILSAVAIPAFQQQGIRAKEKEVELALRQARSAQIAYRTAHGGYADTRERLESFGYDPPTLRYYLWTDEAVTTSGHCVQPDHAGASHRARRIDFETGVLSYCD